MGSGGVDVCEAGSEEQTSLYVRQWRDSRNHCEKLLFHTEAILEEYF